jgi:hypothetical protein
MDRPIKNLLTKAQDDSRKLTGVNSYNIGRPLMQMVHYVSFLELDVFLQSTWIFQCLSNGISSYLLFSDLGLPQSR